MQPDELMTDIAFKAMGDDERGMFIKLGLRRAQAISVVNVAVVVARGEGRVTSARIALGSVAPTIVRADEAETYLVGKELTDDVIAQAAEKAKSSVQPISDVRAPAEYRHDMVRVVTQRALRAIASGQHRGALPENPVLLNQPTTNNHSTTQPLNYASTQPKTLLRLLREDAGLIGTKEGCAEGECGACTVLMEGMAVMSCLVPAPRAQGAHITTIEDLANEAQLHPLQQAFVDEAAVQCGYCTPGFLMAGAALLHERPQPTQDEVEQALAGNLCRCTGYYKILAAFENLNHEGHEETQRSRRR
jgi:carbon-monoxide dehydrogenase medium subunit